MHEICKFTIHGKALILLLWEGSNVKSTARLRLTNVHRLPQALRLAVSNTVAALADKLGGVGSWHGGFGPPGFWNLTVSCWIFSKQFFLVSREKKQFHHLSKNFTPSTKIFLATLGTSGKIHYCPPSGKNPSDSYAGNPGSVVAILFVIILSYSCIHRFVRKQLASLL